MAIQTDYDIKYDAFGRPYYVPKEAQAPAVPTMSVITAKGKKGAEDFKMLGQALILDSTQPVLWYKSVEANGTETLDGYDLSPHEEPPEDNGEGKYNELEQRLKKIEDLLEVIANGGSKPDLAEDDGK